MEAWLFSRPGEKEVNSNQWLPQRLMDQTCPPSPSQSLQASLWALSEANQAVSAGSGCPQRPQSVLGHHCNPALTSGLVQPSIVTTLALHYIDNSPLPDSLLLQPFIGSLKLGHYLMQILFSKLKLKYIIMDHVCSENMHKI